MHDDPITAVVLELMSGPRPISEGSPKRIEAITFFMMNCQAVLQTEEAKAWTPDGRKQFTENVADSLTALGCTYAEIAFVLDVVIPDMVATQDEMHWTPDMEKSDGATAE